MEETRYNPDVLECIANLSNDEVFTPPAVANKMLDLLPKEIWSNKDARFLDPCAKIGVFLREVAKRLIEGLKEEIPDLQERVNHIFGRMLYALPITELTAQISRRTVYCSKDANSEYSVCRTFTDNQGNIVYRETEHDFDSKGRCRHCGASESVFGKEQRQRRESHAYEFIHTTNPEEIFGMKFDVIIGNPPYQLQDGGSGTGISALPLYDKFVDISLILAPKYLIMIIPARWYAGGRGLDDFRNKMLNNNHIRYLVDYPKSRDCFDSVDIAGGVCYFLWDKDYQGSCSVTNIVRDYSDTVVRSLNEFPIFIRYNKAISIIRKSKISNKSFADVPYTSKPFGFRSFARGSDTKDSVNSITLITSEGNFYVPLCDVDKNIDAVSKYKVCVGKINPDRGGVNGEATIYNVINKPFIAYPNEIISETYLLVLVFETESEAINCLDYMKTKFVRFLIFMSLSSMNITNNNFQFVPLQDFSKSWSDEELYAKYGLSEEEVGFIEGMIREM